MTSNKCQALEGRSKPVAAAGAGEAGPCAGNAPGGRAVQAGRVGGADPVSWLITLRYLHQGQKQFL